jgi:hypothetical protein
MSEEEPPKPRPGAQSANEKSADVAVVVGTSDDGKSARILRSHGGRVEMGELRALKEGQSIGQAEIIRLKPRGEDSPVCDVEVLHSPTSTPTQNAAQEAPVTASTITKPAQVATRAYRDSWDRIFGTAIEDEPVLQGKPGRTLN